VSYEQLIAKFYENHDSSTLNRQKGDVGTQYRSGIYWRTAEEKRASLPLLWRLAPSGSGSSN